jgi:hypothetical protein
MRANSTIPLALKALVLLARTAFGGDENVEVIDGDPIPPLDARPDLVCIGFTGFPGDQSVSSTRTREQLATSPDRESYEITNIVSAWRGHEKSMPDVTDRAFKMIDILNDQLIVDQTLGGIVMRARIHSDSVAREMTSRGAVCTVRFIVQIEAFTR